MLVLLTLLAALSNAQVIDVVNTGGPTVHGAAPSPAVVNTGGPTVKTSSLSTNVVNTGGPTVVNTGGPTLH